MCDGGPGGRAGELGGVFEELCGEGEGGRGGGDAGGVRLCVVFLFLGSMFFFWEEKKRGGGIGMLTRMLNRGAVGDEDGGDVPREDGAC